MKHITGFIFAVAITACTDSSNTVATSNPQPDLPDLTGSTPEVTNTLTAHWAKFMVHCPGLVRYQHDMSLSHTQYMSEPAIENGKPHVDVVYKISNAPKSIPGEFRAWGHTCEYQIAADGSTLRIQKDVCVAVCLERKTEGESDYVARLDSYNQTL